MLALVKGNREPHEAKKKSFDLGGNRTHDLRTRSSLLCRLSYKVAQRKSGTILDGESRRRESKGAYECTLIFAAIHHLKSSPTFSVRPCSSVGRVTEDLVRGRGFDSHRGQKIFLCLVWFPVSLY